MNRICRSGLLGLLLALALPAMAIDADAEWAKLHAEAFEQWQKWIVSRDVDRRRQAAESLGGFADQPAVPGLLARALGDDDEFVRLEAASSLWKLADAKADIEPARAALQQALGDASPALRVKAAGALERLGVPAAELVEVRRSVLRHGDWFDVALAVRDAIGSIPAPELVEPLLWSLAEAPPIRDDDRFDAEDVLLPLAKHGDRAVIPGLMAALDAPELPKAVIIEALGTFSPPPEQWLGALLTASRDRDPRTRERALIELRREAQRSPADRRWLQTLVPLLDDRDGDVAYAACELFAEAGGDGHPAVDALLSLAQTKAPDTPRLAAVRALGRIGDPAEAYDRAIKASVAERASAPLQRIAETERDEDLREAAAAALAVITQGSATHTTLLQVSAPGDAAALQRLRARDIEFTEDAFWRALGERDVQTVADLIGAGMSPAQLADGEIPPLHMLVMSGCDYGQPTADATRQLVDLLLKAGADPRQRDAAGDNSVLHRASSCDAALVRQLLKAGVDPKAKNAAKLSAFSTFIVTNPSAAQALIDAGFRLDASEAKSMLGWYQAEQDSIKRRLMEKAGVQAFNVER